MSPPPFIPDTAPFTEEQRAWLNGFLAGLFSRSARAETSNPKSATPNAAQPLTILYATQTGTTEALARKAAKTAAARGFTPTILDVATVTPATLASHANLLLLTSTYGDGEPPDAAKSLHAALAADTSPALTSLRYSVCALGDTNYTLFCQAGKDFDAFLERRGATRIHPRVDCDVDFDAPFETWLDSTLTSFGSPSVAVGLPSDPNPQDDVPPAPVFSRTRPFHAPVLEVRPLNAPGSAKEVNHVVLDLSAAGPSLAYEAGDALGVIPQNDPELVCEVLSALGADGEEPVSTPDGELSLRRALTEYYDLGAPSAALLSALGLSASPQPPDGPSPDLLDALRAAAPPRPDVTNLVTHFRRLAPRLYSISSSPTKHAGEVHLTVGAVRYTHAGRTRKGVCSTFLADRASSLGTVKTYLHSNRGFRLPADPAAPVIMVGPGTGIAPFRSFLHERAASAARGENWLFFGDQRAATDFLYAEELKTLRESGVLTRLELAFSRDQPEKIYVQHRILEHATALFAWLEKGAYFYVCGDAKRMAKDVDAALHQVVERAGGRSPEDAAAYVRALTATKRYQRDVY